MKQEVIYCEWIDNCSGNENWTEKKSVDNNPSLCKTVGFFAKEDTNCLTLALNENSEEFSNCMTIIKACIVKRKRFYV